MARRHNSRPSSPPIDRGTGRHTTAYPSEGPSRGLLVLDWSETAWFWCVRHKNRIKVTASICAARKRAKKYGCVGCKNNKP